MDPKYCSDNNDFFECSKDTRNSNKLKVLLTNPETWRLLVPDMPRDEAIALSESLNYQKTDAPTGEKNTQKERKTLLILTSKLDQKIQELKENIAKLYALADKADKVHRNCTISNVVANSTGIVSGIMTIVGLSLAPFTAGASLAVTIAGASLGAASAVTNVTTKIVEHVKISSIEAESKFLSPNENSTEDTIKEILQKAPRTALGFTALGLSKGTRIFGSIFTVAGLLYDVVSLVEESKDLHKGAKTMSAKCLRERAQELEKKLEDLIQIQKNLDGFPCQGPPWQGKEPGLGWK